MQNKLLLIDGHNLLFQMFFGMPNEIPGKDGQNVAGIWGFTGALLKIINQVNPTHILVIFDGEQELNRKKESENYKKNRIDYTKIASEKNPFSILPRIKAVLEELQIKYLETQDGFETDDYIKEYCKTYENITDIVISSWDTDYLSLVNEHVTLLTYKGKSSVLYTPEKVKSKWKIDPSFFADYKALVGDAADNIAGIPRIGPKMAVSLINDFGHVETILENIEHIQKDSVRLTLDIFKNDLMTNIKLIRLNGIGSIPISLEKLKMNKQERKTKEILKSIELID
ncbi:MAG: flap endonuclease [Bacilli bacterium]|nr:flap endonuclease [Bacilli bacterium]